jgi:hypothetical protein
LIIYANSRLALVDGRTNRLDIKVNSLVRCARSDIEFVRVDGRMNRLDIKVNSLVRCALSDIELLYHARVDERTNRLAIKVK